MELWLIYIYWFSFGWQKHLHWLTDLLVLEINGFWFDLFEVVLDVALVQVGNLSMFSTFWGGANLLPLSKRISLALLFLSLVFLLEWTMYQLHSFIVKKLLYLILALMQMSIVFLFSIWDIFNNSKLCLNICSRDSRPEVFLEKGVLKICSKFTGEHPCRCVISINLRSTTFPKNTSGRLLLLLLMKYFRF